MEIRSNGKDNPTADLENEFSNNGFKTSLEITKDYALTIWKGEKWVAIVPLAELMLINLPKFTVVDFHNADYSINCEDI